VPSNYGSFNTSSVLSGFLRAALGSDTVPPTSPAQVQPRCVLTSKGMVKACEYIEYHNASRMLPDRERIIWNINFVKKMPPLLVCEVATVAQQLLVSDLLDLCCGYIAQSIASGERTPELMEQYTEVVVNYLRGRYADVPGAGIGTADVDDIRAYVVNFIKQLATCGHNFEPMTRVNASLRAVMQGDLSYLQLPSFISKFVDTDTGTTALATSATPAAGVSTSQSSRPAPPLASKAPQSSAQQPKVLPLSKSAKHKPKQKANGNSTITANAARAPAPQTRQNDKVESEDQWSSTVIVDPRAPEGHHPVLEGEFHLEMERRLAKFDLPAVVIKKRGPMVPGPAIRTVVSKGTMERLNYAMKLCDQVLLLADRA
jgi:hypothetical protein